MEAIGTFHDIFLNFTLCLWVRISCIDIDWSSTIYFTAKPGGRGCYGWIACEPSTSGSGGWWRGVSGLMYWG
jgi:hypothetical protein